MTAEEFIKELGQEAPGTIKTAPVNCGAGLMCDEDGFTEEDSFMLVSEQVSRAEFLSFIDKMKENGKKETFRRDYYGNIFVEFYDKNRVIYTYFTAVLCSARIILDNASVPVREFGKTAKATRNDTALMQFALKYGKMIRHKSCDCGMLYAIRLRDNSLIIIDGGESEQATEEACDEIIERLYGMTNQNRKEKLVISLYICTHNHDDHMDVFTKLLRRERKNIVLERAMFNFPSSQFMSSGNECTSRLRNRIREFYPNAKFLKPHTGELIEMPGLQIEILTTHEDILPMSNDVSESTCPYHGMNESTTVFKLWFDDCTAIFLGDAEETNGEAMISLYGREMLSCVFLQCAHHLINDDRNIYAAIKAQKLLVPQCRYIGNTHDSDNTRFLTDKFGAENMYYAGDCTYIFNVSDGVITTEMHEQIGYFFDNSEL